ncbi:hypothetical protein [Mycobacteroides abscessus]|uniref:hypothetical protein n=1 Tax=Mycobacteroides abscessus TaxID=36809 RepID=UPI000C268766|nr:hypothetical protein [Mycobacteroides abscessus]
MTDAQDHDRAALVHGWIANGGNAAEASPYRECVYRLPGTPAYAAVVYALDGVMLWAGGQDAERRPRHFDGIGKADRLEAFLAGR